MDEVVNYRLIPNNTNKWWLLDPCLRWNMVHCMGLCATMFFNGYDGSLFNGILSIDEWEIYFHHPTSNTLGLLNSAGFLPGFVASFFGDTLQRFVGKRITLWISSVIAIAGAIVISLSTSVGIFCAGRAIMGFGTSSAMVVATSHLQEISHPRYRALVGAFYTVVYYIAAITSTAVCLGCLNMKTEQAWRIPCWVQVVGPVVVLVLTVTMPESPRWLVKNGQRQEARQILVKYHANGKEDDELVEYEFREICAAIEAEDNSLQVSYKDFVRTPGNRHRLMILIVQGVSMNWVGNGIISYYLDPILDSLGITSSREQLEILLGLNIWNLIISTAAAVYMDKIGRRPLWLSATSGQFLSMAVIMGLSAAYTQGHQAAGTAVIPFLFLFYGSYDIAYTPMSYFYAVYLAINALLLVIQYYGFPETKNRTIEEIAEVFDGPNTVVSVNAVRLRPDDQEKNEDLPAHVEVA